MRRYILTGPPGAGKTTLLRALEARGYPVVEEAATEINARMLARGIAHPHLEPDFLERIAELQRERLEAACDGEVQFHDRSAICTYALAMHLGRPVPEGLLREIERVRPLYQRQVFFVRNLGFIENTPIRRISFEDALAFERRHEEAYSRFGFELVELPAADVAERLDRIVVLANGG